MDFIPEQSELRVENIVLTDQVVKDLIKELGVKKYVPGFKK